MNNEVESYEISIEEAKENIALRDALERLHNNADFKKIIGEVYFKDEAIRLVHAKAHNSSIDEKQAAALDKAMVSIGTLNQFFNRIYQFADMAEKALADAEEAREAALEEEATV